jgi:hypothetical protein
VFEDTGYIQVDFKGNALNETAKPPRTNAV